MNTTWEIAHYENPDRDRRGLEIRCNGNTVVSLHAPCTSPAWHHNALCSMIGAAVVATFEKSDRQ